MTEKTSIAGTRPPIIAVVGHIDHGKSSLLDYIRKSNVVAGEKGGITQHLSAYEAVHKNASGEHRLTFLDTPGHEAFRAMRARGVRAADVAILVVSAEEGVKPQTVEALHSITEAKVPYVIAFTKIDKPEANLERAKHSLLEHQIFIEGLGGEVPWVAISSKTGEGIPELLDLLLLAAELEGLSANPALPGEGVVIEAHVDNKRGNTATLMVHDGSLKSGQCVVAGSAWAPTRIMENFAGETVKEVLPGSPTRLVGFSTLPAVGALWKVVASKREAETLSAAALAEEKVRAIKPNVILPKEGDEPEAPRLVLPLVIKADVAGSGEAIQHELEKIPQDPRLEVRTVVRGVGPVSESDAKMAGGGVTPGIILAFNVKVEREAREMAERLGVTIESFDIIYKLSEWLRAELEKRRPRQATEVQTGTARVLKFFSAQKGRVVLGGRVEEGELAEGQEVRVLRRDVELGRGKIISLQAGKKEVKKIEAGTEFGAMVKLGIEPAANDRLAVFTIEER